MIILAINNSNGKSFSDSRKILGKYLFQISPNTYSGKLSESAYAILIEDLKKLSLKSMSVQLYKFYRKRFEMCYNVGNLNDISSGIYPFKTSNILKDNLYMIRLNDTEKLLKEITILSGLFHDLGKNNLKFQEKLRSSEKSNKADFVRHEVISFFILENIKLEILNSFKKNNSDFKNKDLTNLKYFEFLSNIDNVKYLFSNIKDDFFETIDVLNETQLSSSKFDNHQSIINFVNFLVLTHHKLSDNFLENNNLTNDVFDNINVKNLINEYLILKDDYSEEDYKKNFKMHNREEFLNEKFILEISITSKRIFDILSRVNNIDTSNLFYYVIYLCRPVLINSDYMGSNDKEISSDFNITLANTKNNLPADSLSTHLFKVAKYCGLNFELFLHNKNKTNDFHSFSIENTTNRVVDELKINEDFDLGKIEHFKWQQDTVNKILNLNNPSPTFGVIVSETGTGKTRAIPKIMTALNCESVRYNLLLGLTTLTNQTYTEYMNLGLKKYVNCLIGGEIVKNEVNSFIESGTFNDIDKNFNFETIVKEKITFENNDNFYSMKEKNILQKPIIVATIDHFINHGSLSNGSTTNLYLRSLSSDLVLDEIDNYNSSQLNMISRLIFLAGLFGKNVIISSATTSPIITNNLFNIWNFGLEQYFKLNKISKSFNYLCVSNYKTPTFIKNIKDGDSFSFRSDYNDFLTKHIEKIENKVNKHNLKVLDISSEINLNEVYSKIFKNCIDLHNINCEIHSNKKVSVGYVKFNLVENTIDFARFLSEVELDDDTDIFIFCYHSKFILKDKENNEKYLNKLQRKHRKLSEIEFFKDLINNSNKKNVMFIISTSPVIEVGRDHDYDYAVLDISSTEALIQGAGRVRRHRNYNYEKTNILLLSSPVSKLMSSNIKQFQKSIIKNTNVLNNYSDKIFKNLSFKFESVLKNEVDLNNVEKILNKLLHDKKLSNKYCLMLNLNYDDNVLKSSENIALDLQLNNDNFSYYLAQNKFIEFNKTCLMSNKFMKFLKFRDGKNKIIRLVNDEYFIDENDGMKLTTISVENDFNHRFFVSNFKVECSKKENIYYQLNLNYNDEQANLKYSNIFGLIINKYLKI